ncbi:MAG: hypothetical protein QME88_11165 [Actinomycetota bacterium]|nr:hypothetical protein [Actinomycetota bacterium]
MQAETKRAGIGPSGALGKGRRALELVLDICGHAFLASFAVYLVLLAMEEAKKGSVTFFFDPDKALYICLATGAAYILGGRYLTAESGMEQGLSPLRRALFVLAVAALAFLLTYRIMSSYRGYAFLAAAAVGMAAGAAAFAASTSQE